MNISRFILLVFVITGHPAFAHHNWAAIYDAESDVEIEGEISAIKWRNPHVTLEVIVDKGEETEKVWLIASNSVSNLSRMQVTSDLLKAGDLVRVAGYASRRSDDGLFMNHLLMPDGREVVFLRGAEPRWEGEHIGDSGVLHGKVVETDFTKRPTSIFAVWTTVYGDRGSHRSFTPTEQIPWTEAALQILAANEASNVDPLINCTPKGMPVAMSAPYPIQLVDAGDRIVIQMEEYDAVRTVHLTTTHNDRDVKSSNLGFSTGFWENDTLVVVTTKMNYGLVAGTEPQSLDLQLRETFRLREDHNHLDYTQEITDPEMRSETTVNKRWFRWRPGAKINPYDCDEA